MNIPKKWCIKLQDNYDVINNWGRKHFTPITSWGNLGRFDEYMCCNFEANHCTSTNSVTGYTEITFEQFEKHILNKETPAEDYSYLIKLFKELNIN